MRDSLKRYLARTSRRDLLRGLGLTALCVVAIELLVRFGLLIIPNPPAIAILPIIYASFSGGIAGGLLASLVAVFYGSYYFSIPGTFLDFEPDDLLRVVAMLIATPAIALMTSAMRERAALFHEKQLAKERDYRSKAETAAAAWQRGQQMLRLVMDTLPAMIVYIDADERYVICNRLHVEAFGISEDQVRGRKVREVIGEELYRQAKPWIDKALSGEPANYERNDPRPDGSVGYVSVAYVPHPDASGRALGFYAMIIDITERKRLEDKLAHMAQHDHLTRLPNRALLEDRLQQALERGKRRQDPITLMYLDIDRFKAVNDTLGHKIGDELLKAFAGRLSECTRSTDTVARLGGDEFVIIMEDLQHRATATRLAEKILASLREPFDLDGSAVLITTSIGVALVQGGEVTPIDALAKADGALYRAKASGRNTFHIA
ncbi:MAG: diguanylate cyclase [Betaproteobacteria bacterium]|nr:diguanylate cyclase [Betaproteobacteria bacterium]